MFPGRSRDERLQPTVVPLELKAIPLTAGRADLADVECSRQRRRKTRNRSISPLRVENLTARTGVASYKRSALTDEVGPAFVGLLRDGRRRDPAAAVTSRKVGGASVASHLPALSNSNVDSKCLVSDVDEFALLPRKWEGAARPFEVCALRLNPGARSTAAGAQLQRQQSSVVDGDEKIANSVSETSSSSSHLHTADSNSAVKFDTRLPLSDIDDDEEEMAGYDRRGNASKTSTSRSTPGPHLVLVIGMRTNNSHSPLVHKILSIYT